MNHRDLYNQLKADLIKAGATIEHKDADMAITAGMRDYYRDDEDFYVPDDLFGLFESFDGLDLRWTLKNEGQNLSGFFQFAAIEDMLENKTENKLYADWYQPEDIAEIKKHRILEMLNGTDCYVTIVFNKGNDYTLYYVPDDGVNFGGSKMLAKIPLTIEQYVQIVFGYYGVYSVRHHLHKPEFYQDPQSFIPEYALLKLAFPDFDPPQINPIDNVKR
jgi:hypothetical protein